MGHKENLTKIADSIRMVKGSNNKIIANNFAGEISKMAYVDGGNITGVIQNQNEQVITPTTTNQVISAGKYLKGNQTIKGDSNLLSKYILRGENDNLISIFGVNGKVDKIRRIESYKGGSGYYGDQVADVARSYHLARISGIANFKYTQSKNPFNGYVTDSNGYCGIDCSGFASLCLRGIDYIHSPFNGATGTINKTFNPSDIATLCANSEYEWADEYLDKQVDKSFKNIGISGYRSIRTAAQIAEYYYGGGNGSVLYEYDTSPTTSPTDLLAGDLIFWSKPSGNNAQISRFKAITHVAIVSRDTTKFYQVTGDESTKGDTVFCSNLADSLQYISLIIRPNYNPRTVTITPTGMNLLPKYRFDSCGISANITINDILFSPRIDGGLDVKGVASANTTFYIHYGYNTITLTPGTYVLSGTPVHPQVDVNGTTLDWGITIKTSTGATLTDINGRRVWDRGQTSTFNITETTEIYAYISINTNLTSTDLFTFKPSLIKL